VLPNSPFSELTHAALAFLACWLSACGTDIYFSENMDGTSATTSNCEGVKGPVAVQLDGYCIDSTEVSEAQYAEFLASGPSVSEQRADCTWNQYFEPQPYYMDVPRGPYEPDRADYPVTEVDFCDARAYCEWAGKRLCGKRGGGAFPLDRPELASESEWFQACSGGGALAYPYGQDFDEGACAVRSGQHPVGVQRTCEGGFPGVFDLIGNVWEWEDSCIDENSQSPSDVICSRRGGATTVEPTNWLCADRGDASARLTRQVDMGIRCCSNTLTD
jgi:formylglycine-generating enzyme required for sulfatase activity